MPTVKAVTSRDNPLLVRIRRLAADPGAYRRLGEIWLEGEHLCAAFVQRGGLPMHAVITEAAWRMPRWRDLAAVAPAVAVVSPAVMADLSTLESPAPLGFVVPWQGAGTLRPGSASVVLDRLQDAGNVGTILRTASAFGFAQVLAMKGTAAMWSPKVLRAGMGAHFALRLVEGLRVEELAALRLPLVAATPHASVLLPQARLPAPCAWVLGHEGQGIHTDLLARCAITVRIPQPGGEESLNVAAAAAVCLYESACRQAAG